MTSTRMRTGAAGVFGVSFPGGEENGIHNMQDALMKVAVVIFRGASAHCQ